MIKIKRPTCPKRLVGTPIKGALYNCKPVVDALWKMQHGKCAYCEMKIPDKGHLKAVEHFAPKSIFTGKKNDWKNLLLLCSQCNGKKSAKFPVELTSNHSEPEIIYLVKGGKGKAGKAVLIDPADHQDDDPEVHIDFIVDGSNMVELGMAIPKSQSMRGKYAIEVIGLSDLYYNKERTSHYCILMQKYANLISAKNDNNDDAVKEILTSFNLCMLATAKFAAFTRCFCRDRKLDVNFDITIPKGHEKILAHQ